jgi:hypothetical protein
MSATPAETAETNAQVQPAPLESDASSLDALFARLSAHGINCNMIRHILAHIPQATLFFQRLFPQRSFEQVFDDLDRWRKFLERDRLLSPEEKHSLQRILVGKELIAFNALLENLSSQHGQWLLQASLVPSGHDENGSPLYTPPGLKLSAQHQETKEAFVVLLHPSQLSSPAECASSWRKLFVILRLRGVKIKASEYEQLVSARDPQGWPIFTRYIVPQLYDCLIQSFPRKAHYYDLPGQVVAAEPQANAMYPQELLETMVEILRFGLPDIFHSTTVADVRGVIQRHLSRSRKDTNSAKTPQEQT